MSIYHSQPSTSSIKSQPNVGNLLKQIKLYKDKICKLQKFDTELQNIKSQKQKIQSPPLPQRDNPKSLHKKTNINKNNNPNKKVKVYQLQRKLNRLRKQQKENQQQEQIIKKQILQFNIKCEQYQQAFQQEQSISNNLIIQQKQKLNELYQLDTKIQEQQINLAKCCKEQEILEQQLATLTNDTNEIKDKIDRINDDQYTNNDQTILLQISNSYEQLENFHSVINSGCVKFKSLISETQLFDQIVENVHDDTENYSQNTRDKLIYQLKLQQNKSEQLINQANVLQKQISQLQFSWKHQSTTEKILSNQYSFLKEQIQRENQHLNQIKKQITSIVQQLGEVQSKQVQMRDELVMKVQQHKLLKLINNELNKDLKSIKGLIVKLNVYYNQFGNDS